MAVIGVALARNAQTARAIVLPFTCESTTNVGDIVYPDPINDLKVLSNTNNSIIQQSIGVVLEKSSPTDCKVVVCGLVGGYSGLSRGGKIYLSTSGTITQSPPATGYLQQLGVAVSEVDVLLNVNWERVKRI